MRYIKTKLHIENIVKKMIFIAPAFLFTSFLLLNGCSNKKIKKLVQLITLDPGHFHAALVQKSIYANVESNVYVHAPGGNDLKWHLDRITGYNTRQENPIDWNQQVYTGDDFFEKMIAGKRAML
jgi:hypothetical protein